MIQATLIRYREFFRRSILLQYMLYLVVAANISLVMSLYLLRPALNEVRTQNAKMFTQLAMRIPAKAGLPDLSVFDDFKQYMGLELWVVNGAGEAVVASHTKPLPLEWSAVKLPEAEMEVASTNIPGKPLEALVAVRLIYDSAIYLILYQSDTGRGTYIIASYVILLCIWLFLVSTLGTYFVFRWKLDSPVAIPKVPKNPESGFTLISALIGLAIMAMGLVALQSMLSLSFRSSSHADLRGAVRSLSDSIKQQVDCAKTFEGLSLPSTCTLGTPIRLKNVAGADITQPLVSGPFAPDTVGGAGKLGSWYLRASCDSPDGNLVVRYSRPQKVDPSGKAEFFVDPLNKRAYDWTASDTNPLFGPPARQLCRGPGGGAGPPGPPPVASSIKRMGVLAVNLPVYNSGAEGFTIDLTKSPPLLLGLPPGANIDMTKSHMSEPFLAAPFAATVAVRFFDVRQSYSNVAALPIPQWDQPKPGVLRVLMGQNTDVEVPATGQPVKGSMGVVITLFQ